MTNLKILDASYKSSAVRKPVNWQSSLYDKFSNKQNRLQKSKVVIIKKQKMCKNSKLFRNKQNIERICKYCSNILKNDDTVHNIDKCREMWRKSCFYKAVREIDF